MLYCHWYSQQHSFSRQQHLSACPWEPHSEQELAEGVGFMQLVALVSIEDGINSSTSNSSSSCTGGCGSVRGTVLQQLSLSLPGPHSQVLQLPQQTQHKQEPSTGLGQHVRRRSSAAAAAAAGSEGVVWGIDSCPAAVLQALYEAASAALKMQLASALESASAMSVRLFEHTALCCMLPALTRV